MYGLLPAVLFQKTCTYSKGFFQVYRSQEITFGMQTFLWSFASPFCVLLNAKLKAWQRATFGDKLKFYIIKLRGAFTLLVMFRFVVTFQFTLIK